MDSVAEKYRRRIGQWRCATLLLATAFFITLVSLIAIVIVRHREMVTLIKNDMPCPPRKGGLVTSSDPSTPGPFHDITIAEYHRLYDYLKSQPDLKIVHPDHVNINTSYIFATDLMLPPKAEVLQYLDSRGQQPDRYARVMVFRGDLNPPVVEEYRVGPLSGPKSHELILNSRRRNPAPFTFRPISFVEYTAIESYVLPKVDREVGYLLKESYGGSFTNCGSHCITYYPHPIGSALLGRSDKRQMWIYANYFVEYYTLHPLDFGVRLSMENVDPDKWTVDQVWYSGSYYNSLNHLATAYNDTTTIPGITKTKIPFRVKSPDLYSTQGFRGDPMPETPQRPPLQVEPDGKRYTITHRHVKYLKWDFDIRLSSFIGPQVYDIKWAGERIAYEIGLAEIGVFYSGSNPGQRVTDFVDSGALLGTHSKSLISGTDCPETAVYLNTSFLAEAVSEPITLERATCVFEHNTGVPLRRHLSYSTIEGGFYGGMADSVLVVRSILTVVNYDYVFDFVFHQNGALEIRVISTGYILSTFYSEHEKPYGYRLENKVNGNMHHHIFSYKVDVDIYGTSNRFETLEIGKQVVDFPELVPGAKYEQIYFEPKLHASELDAVYNFNFDHPKYLLVHNNANKTSYGVPKAYRILLKGMSKQMLTKGVGNENTIPWARHQLAVTLRKEDEFLSSSPYAMFDSFEPVTDFSKFIEDNDTIVDQDLVFWVTLGTHHIPHTEDLPVTPTTGGHLSFFLLPNNYFKECPSVSSRDNIHIEYAEPYKPESGLKLERNGNPASTVCGVQTLEEIVQERPDDLVQTHNDFHLV